MDEKELERLAQEELLNEAKRGKLRAETMGALGWQKSPIPTTNKRFLSNIIRSTLEPSKKKSKTTDHQERERLERHHQDLDGKKQTKEKPNKLCLKEHKIKRSSDYRRDRKRTKHRHKDVSKYKSNSRKNHKST